MTALVYLHFTALTVIFCGLAIEQSGMHEGHPINNLQNGIIVLIFKL